MKQIDNYFFEDDFEYREDTFFGVKLFCDGKSIYSNLFQLFYANAIGRKCEICGGFAKKYCLLCEECQNKKDVEKFLSLPVGEETEYLYSETKDKYFEKDDWDIIYDYLLEVDDITKVKFSDLRIHPCVPAFADKIDIGSLFEDTYEDFDVEAWSGYEELQKAVDKANEVIGSNPTGVIYDYTKRIEITDEEWGSLISQANIDREIYNESNI